ncbi:sugar transferase [Aurantiacibacter rhizosphaerae]|uniref:Sugar transferase n=1 Tax=Aurantiacibacter rhizosphaerae TaxID=2691582 RepID=A0A844XDA4_9SPHN|nr:sugar transferase [Aurantiacibacter rhizosphaerae]MWV27588.1 sugar transferase [Aurantiacibacter rhizosphaerae]
MNTLKPRQIPIMFSRFVALVLLILALPILAVLAVLVALSMGRPVMFRQTRSGKGGEGFTLVKFRSMNDARDARGELLPDEERTGAVGTLLRRSRLDELPGLWNVVSGDMNFVGPRPLLPPTIAEKGEVGRRRGAVKPGLTGWAQVNGNTLLSLDEKMALDLWYIENRSMALDLRIIMRTLLVMVGGERRTPTVVGNAKN